MKELSIEEKVKRYDEALHKAKNYYSTTDSSSDIKLIGLIFPELKESEDEKMMRVLIGGLKSYIDMYSEWYDGVSTSEIIAWLEKQGEQSSLNTNQDCLKGIKRVQEYRDLSDWEKEFDDIASIYAHNKNQEGYNNSHYVKERAAEMLYHAKKELEKQGRQKPLYIRFGDVPSNETSKIYRGEVEIGEENGVSVYPAFEVNGNIVLGLTLPITKTTLYTQQHLLEYDNRPCYLVSGDYVGKGTDGEPLIRNITIIKRLDKKFEIEEGKWYVCIRDLLDNYANKAFCKGDIYLSTQNGSLIPSNSNVPFEVVCPDTYFKDWTIQNAKDGDVLELDCGIGIFKDKCIDGYNIHCYCYYSNEGVLEINKDSLYDTYQSHPATKEQRDTLERAMTNAGYRWDAEHKQLNKIEQKSATTSLDEAIEHCREKSCGNNACALEHKQLEKWLTELKELKEQKPAEWSDDDEKRMNHIIQFLEDKDRWKDSERAFPIEEDVRWLKSRFFQKHWKPSEEQMKFLWKYAEQNNYDGRILSSLYDDLKKL